MKNVILLILGCMVLVWCGCQPEIYTLTNGEKEYPKTDPSSIKVTTRDKLDGEFTVIGYVWAPPKGSIEASINMLKERAAKMGGNTVISLQTWVVRQYVLILFIPIPIDNYYCRGIVVKS